MGTGLGEIGFDSSRLTTVMSKDGFVVETDKFVVVFDGTGTEVVLVVGTGTDVVLVVVFVEEF